MSGAKYVAGLALLLPFDFPTPIIEFSGHLVRNIHFTALLVVVAVGIEGRDRLREVKRAQAIPAGLLTLLLIVSLIFANSFLEQAGMSTRRIVTGIALSLAVPIAVRTRKDAELIAFGLVAGACVAGVLGLVDVATGAGVLESFGSSTVYGPVERLTLPFPHANVAAVYFSGTGLLALGLAGRGSVQRRFPLQIVAVLLIALSLLSYSRGVLVGTVAGLAFLAVMNTPRLWILLAVVAVVIASPSWRLRLQDPPPRHFYGVELVSNGSSVQITNASRVAWPEAGQNFVLQAFSAAGEPFEPRQVPLGPLDPGESTTMPVDLRDGSQTVFADVVRPGEGSFSSLTGQRPLIIAGNPTTAQLSVGRRIGVLPRVELWRAAGSLIRMNPVTGVGPGNFRFEYQSIVDRDGPQTSHAHNLVLEPSASWGLPAAIVFLAMLASALMLAFRARVDPLAASVTAVLVLFVVSQGVDWLLASTAGGLMFWIFVGMAWTFPERDDENHVAVGRAGGSSNSGLSSDR